MKSLEPFGTLFEPQSFESFHDLPLENLKLSLEHDKLILVRGLKPLERNEFLRFVLSFARKADHLEEQLLHWDFGPVMELKTVESTENYLFSNESVPFHWDGAFHREPLYLAFNCIEAPSRDSGGETLFTNTELILENTSSDTKEEMSRTQLTYETEKKAHYGGTVTVPMLQKHPHTRADLIRFAEPVATELNPVSMRAQGSIHSHRLVNEMTEAIYDSKYCYRHQWQEGDLLLVDNFSTIHGRNAFSKNTSRHIRRIQVL